MKKNVFIFHGTEGSPDENWFPWLKQELSKRDYEVIIPKFPSPPIVPAKIDEWFSVLREYEDRISENTVLIGHSLGGVFTLRVLEKLKSPIKAALFVGTPIGVKPIISYDRENSFSGFAFDWKTIRSNSKDFVVYQSDNDPYVGLEDGEQLAENLRVALSYVPNAGHFNKKAGYLKFDQLRDKVLELLEK